jgi:pyridoxamine 5'-phosphate oxidase family protein
MQPHVVPVAYTFDGRSIFFGGWNLAQSLKYRNVMASNKVALVVDEVVSARPWRVRGIEVRGRAEPTATKTGGVAVKISPVEVRSWGLRK